MPTKRKVAVKKKAAPKKEVTIIAGERRMSSERRIVKVPHEELNAVEQALKDGLARLKKWYRS